MQYTVNRGDTLYGIAKQFNTSVDSIKQLNNLKDNTISVGQVLKIMEDSNPAFYTVQKGDSLYSISKKTGVSIIDLLDYNGLSSTVLQIGQVLSLIPKSVDNEEIVVMPVYENYVVKKGDSLYSIATKYKISVDQIKKDNSLKSNLLSIGQVLKIKVGEEIFGIEECFGDNVVTPTKKYLNYTVKKGDSLYSIAKNYNTSVDNIKRLNNLVSNVLQIGQILKIKEI